MGDSRIVGIAGAAWALVIAACSGGGDGIESTAESCMTCHNGSPHDDYAGPGLQNPHPFPGADELRCTTCHGGNPKGNGQASSHVPPPPEIGDDENLETDPHAYFNRLTLTGIDKFPDYTVGGKTGTTEKYLQELQGYSEDDRIASFIGLAPVTDPQIVVAVVLDSPHGLNEDGDELYFGGVSAAPVFAEIAEAALHQLGVAPDAR